jgi:hypothetical protein
MNERQAIARLRKLIGPKLAYRVDHKAPTADEREVIRAKYDAAKQAADAAVAARKARYEQLLAGDAEYQRLKAEASAAETAATKARAGLHARRITVGRDQGWIFSVVAEGDNWSEVVDKVVKNGAPA